MASPQQGKREEATRKAVTAAATAAGSAVVIAAGAPVAGAVGLGVSAYLGYKWIRFRIENSIRF